MKYNRKRTARPLVVGLLLGVGSLSGQEAEQFQREDVTLDAFEVSGTRATLSKSRDFKKASAIVSDTIIAEDMAKFPDLNLAESLQRLPGVAINREAGEGRRVSLRGLGPDFTRVQLNGMEVLGNVDSPQDSRGQRSRDRAFDFNIFASELFNRLEVRKSFDATQNEGGLAGTVGLITAKPFDYGEGVNAAVSAQIGSNTYTEDLQPRTAFQISNTWDDTFGALLSVAYSTRDTDEQGTNTYRFRPAPDERGSDISGLPAADQIAINTGQLRFPRGNRQSSWQSHQERLGITSAFQWRPNENLEFTFDIMHGQFTGERDELHIASRGDNSSSWLGGGTTVDGVVYPDSTINEIRYNAGGDVLYLDVSGGNHASETRRQLAENVFDQYLLTTRWRINDDLIAHFLIGTETSNFDVPISDKFYLEAFGDVISDYTRDRFYLHNSRGFDQADPAHWRAHEIDFAAHYQESSFDNAKVDFEYYLSASSALKFGAARQVFFNSGYRQTNNNLLRSEFQSGAVNDDPTGYAVLFRDHRDLDWTIVDFDAALDALGVDRDPGNIRSVYDVEEATLAAYLSYDWDTTVGGMGFLGNVGLRAYDTTVTSRGTANVGPVTVKDNYEGVLPALNTTLKIQEDLLLRVGLSQNINRPSIGSMAVNGNVRENAGEYTVSVGNPGLEPYDSDSVDIALEWYFGEVGSFAIGYYHKDITGFIGSLVRSNVPYRETGLPIDLLPGLTNDTNVSVFTTPVNYEDTTLQGLELSLQSDLAFLPAPFDKLGFVGNLTFIDGELDYATPAEQAAGVSNIKPIAGLSDLLGNLTIYYETRQWGARVSANYRNDYVARPTPIADDEDGNGFNSTLYVDFSAFYQINEKLKLTVDAINLTNQREEQFSDLIARRHYNTTSSGTTIYTGINYQF
ncbi:MAG: TonB-dependent receptor [Synoicihabitans sp.]